MHLSVCPSYRVRSPKLKSQANRFWFEFVLCGAPPSPISSCRGFQLLTPLVFRCNMGLQRVLLPLGTTPAGTFLARVGVSMEMRLYNP